MLCAGLLVAIYCESRRNIVTILSVVFATVWIVEASVLAFVMPRFDSYRDQTLLADRTNQRVPPGEPVYLVRLPESQISYYLRPALRRYDDPQAFSGWLASTTGPVYALAPEFVVDDLISVHEVEVLDRCASINRFLTPRDRLTLVRLKPRTADAGTQVAGLTEAGVENGSVSTVARHESAAPTATPQHNPAEKTR